MSRYNDSRRFLKLLNFLYQFVVFAVILTVTQAGVAPVSYASVAGHGLGVGPIGPGGVYIGGPARPLAPIAPAVSFAPGPGPFGYGVKAVAPEEGVDYYVSAINIYIKKRVIINILLESNY